MKLTKKDIQLITSWGFPEEDLKQIERATTKTKTIYEFKCKEISRDEAIEILGRDQYLSGICRSAFHYTSARYNDKNETVYFNSSKLFQ